MSHPNYEASPALIVTKGVRGKHGLAAFVGSALVFASLGVAGAPHASADTYADGTNTWTYTTSGSTATITACSPCAGSVTIPSSILVPGVSPAPDTTYTVTTVGYRAIYDKRLTSLIVPVSVTAIGEQAVAYSDLTSVSFAGPVGGLLTLGKEAFVGAPLTSVSIPNSVTSVGEGAFKDANSLASVTLGSSVASIGKSAFQSTAITSIVIPDSMRSIGDLAFAFDSSLTSLSLGSGVQTLGDYAFYGTRMTSVNVPTSVTAIGKEAFSTNPALASVTLNSGVLTIGEAAFKSCGFTSITIPGTVTTLGPQAFMSNPALATATLGSGLTSIGASSFASTGLTSIAIPNGVTSVGANAFQGASSLVSVTLGSGVMSLGNMAFAFATALTSITFAGAPPTIGSSIFLFVPATKVLIPTGAGWPAPPTTFGGIATEYVSSPAPTPVPTPAPAPAPAGLPTPTSAPTATMIAAPVEGLIPVTAAGGGALPPEGVRPGGSLLLVGGQLVPVAVDPEPGPRPTVITASGPGFIASFGGLGDDGIPLPLGASRALVVQSVQPGRSGALPIARATMRSAVRWAHGATGTGVTSVAPVVASSGDGYLPGSTIRFYVLPDILMGDLVTDGTGAFDGDVPVPAGIAPGTRTLQMNGYAPDGSVRSLSIGILVKGAGVVAVKKKRASVFFAPMSAKITAQGMATLRRLVTAAGSDAAGTRVVGFVRDTGANDNDGSLSTARAAAVKAALRSLGLRGPIDDRGDGAAVQDGPAARRATVTIRYRRRFGRR